MSKEKSSKHDLPSLCKGVSNLYVPRFLSGASFKLFFEILMVANRVSNGQGKYFLDEIAIFNFELANRIGVSEKNLGRLRNELTDFRLIPENEGTWLVKYQSGGTRQAGLYTINYGLLENHDITNVSRYYLQYDVSIDDNKIQKSQEIVFRNDTAFSKNKKKVAKREGPSKLQLLTETGPPPPSGPPGSTSITELLLELEELKGERVSKSSRTEEASSKTDNKSEREILENSVRTEEGESEELNVSTKTAQVTDLWIYEHLKEKAKDFFKLEKYLDLECSKWDVNGDKHCDRVLNRYWRLLITGYNFTDDKCHTKRNVPYYDSGSRSYVDDVISAKVEAVNYESRLEEFVLCELEKSFVKS